VDLSNSYGENDSYGWYYAATFDRLQEAMDHVSAVSSSAKSSVRKRRWIRNVICNSEELEQRIQHRIEEAIEKRIIIEGILRDKETVFKNIKFYEENRSFVFSQSLHLATQGILNTFSILKELINKLKLMKQVFLRNFFLLSSSLFLLAVLFSFFRTELLLKENMLKSSKFLQNVIG
jgi:HD-GYP domain-containing protein (c-di-GMP phosphodiesterase class II)